VDDFDPIDSESRNFHALRRSRVIHLRDEGVPFSTIRELTRHDDISTLRNIYGRKEEWKGDIPAADI